MEYKLSVYSQTAAGGHNGIYKDSKQDMIIHRIENTLCQSPNVLHRDAKCIDRQDKHYMYSMYMQSAKTAADHPTASMLNVSTSQIAMQLFP